MPRATGNVFGSSAPEPLRWLVGLSPYPEQQLGFYFSPPWGFWDSWSTLGLTRGLCRPELIPSFQVGRGGSATQEEEVSYNYPYGLLIHPLEMLNFYEVWVSLILSSR